jgi:hypothetical protein
MARFKARGEQKFVPQAQMAMGGGIDHKLRLAIPFHIRPFRFRSAEIESD